MVQDELEKMHCNYGRFYSLKSPHQCTKRSHTDMIAHGCYCVRQTQALASDLGFPIYTSLETQCYLLISALYRH